MVDWRTMESVEQRAFFRAEAAPAAAPGQSSYVQLYNPPDSGVRAVVEAFWSAMGHSDASEYGLFFYPAPIGTLRGNLHSTWVGVGDPSKAVVRVYTGPWPLIPQVLYFDHAPSIHSEPMLKQYPFPLVLVPGAGIVIGNATQQNECKVGFWIREEPSQPGDPELPPQETYAKLNPADAHVSLSLSNGNLTVAKSGAVGHGLVRSDTALVGKTYWEVATSGHLSDSVNVFGVQSAAAALSTNVGGAMIGCGMGYSDTQGAFFSSGFSASGAPVALGAQTFGVAVDAVAGKVWIRNAGGWLSGDPAAGTSPTFTLTGTPASLFPAASLYKGGQFTFAFDPASFTWTAPAGFGALTQ